MSLTINYSELENWSSMDDFARKLTAEGKKVVTHFSRINKYDGLDAILKILIPGSELNDLIAIVDEYGHEYDYRSIGDHGDHIFIHFRQAPEESKGSEQSWKFYGVDKSLFVELIEKYPGYFQDRYGI